MVAALVLVGAYIFPYFYVAVGQINCEDSG